MGLKPQSASQRPVGSINRKEPKERKGIQNFSRVSLIGTPMRRTRLGDIDGGWLLADA